MLSSAKHISKHISIKIGADFRTYGVAKPFNLRACFIHGLLKIIMLSLLK